MITADQLIEKVKPVLTSAYPAAPFPQLRFPYEYAKAIVLGQLPPFSLTSYAAKDNTLWIDPIELMPIVKPNVNFTHAALFATLHELGHWWDRWLNRGWEEFRLETFQYRSRRMKDQRDYATWPLEADADKFALEWLNKLEGTQYTSRFDFLREDI